MQCITGHRSGQTQSFVTRDLCILNPDMSHHDMSPYKATHFERTTMWQR
jgi:hypothetical protein